MRTSSLGELRQLCRGIRKSFVHLETRDSYGTETELPHLARWRRGEPGGQDTDRADGEDGAGRQARARRPATIVS